MTDTAADVDAMLLDLWTSGLGVKVALGGTTVYGLKDKGAGVMTDPGGLSTQLEPESVVIREDALTVTAGAAITVTKPDGTTSAYKARDGSPEPIDGGLTRIIVVR